MLCLAGSLLPARAGGRIDATTRNHSTSAEAVEVFRDGVAKLPILISEKASAATKARAEELFMKVTGHP